jgi:hypothetical protein
MTTGVLPERRQEMRVIFTRTVDVFSLGKFHGRYPARNISLAGLFVEGRLDLPVGQECRLEFHEVGLRSSLILEFYGMVRRKTESGIGINFTSMEDDSFMFLQTIILYSSDDPPGVAEHFLDRFVLKSVTT